MPQRIKRSKDLGEMMVIAHAVVAAEAGNNVTVLTDDQGGKTLAASEANRLYVVAKLAARSDGST